MSEENKVSKVSNALIQMGIARGGGGVLLTGKRCVSEQICLNG